MSDDLKAEFFSLAHTIAIGRRKMLVSVEGKEKRDYEVYVRLMSGSSFAVASGCSKKEARKTLVLLAHQIMDATGSPGFAATRTDLILMQHVARCYTDTQENHHVAVIEDSSGASYVLEEGGKERCDEAVRMLTAGVLQCLTKGAAP